jgi:murein tripeptide amidase MpaA
MHISSNFDSGNIQVVKAEDHTDIQLTIRQDHQSEFYQWFHFRLQSTPFISHNININALKHSAYPEGWKDYYVVASYDRQEWFRVESEFDGERLQFEFTPEHDSVYFAYFAPYSYERHLDLISSAQVAFDCRHKLLGQTLDGRDISLLIIGEADANKPKVWITARQHPGETMAEWCAEGMIARLLDEHDGVGRELLDKAVFYIVPNMNPDGSVRGHLRTNAAGVNLNREWQNPSLNQSPEVYLVLKEMERVGVDMYLDLHGDEALPYNFVAGSEGIPSFDQKMESLETLFKSTLLTITPEFQVEYGYPKDPPGEANLTVASNAVAEKFKCMALTVEMPFKDNANLPDLAYGWSPQRSIQFGEDLLVATRAVLSQLS